jgi:hypothetical protein
MTLEQIKALQAAAKMFIDAVKEAGSLGAPAGVMYAAVMGKLSLSQFEQIMSGLVRAGKLRKEGDLYFVAGGAS